LPKAWLALVILCFLTGAGCSTSQMHKMLEQDQQAPQAWPKMLAVYMPWFGNHVHKDVGYSSDDPVELRRQIEQAHHMGISAFVVDWYGKSEPFSDHNFGLLEEAADDSHFQVALLYNESADEDEQSTDEAVAAVDWAYTSYIGPQAQHRAAYLTYNGRPMIFVFPKHGKVNWNRVVDHCRTWEEQPLLFYKDDPPAQYAADFSGSFAWVQPGADGWQRNGSNWGKQYLEAFYRNMTKNHPDKIAIGAAWPGFNDAGASWGLNRHMQSRCGQTLEDTLHLYGRYYDAANPLPFLLIETWNDYEEGTAIERLNFTHCKESSASPQDETAASRLGL
jgi:hypothetical protein